MDVVTGPSAPDGARAGSLGRLACALFGHRPDAPPIWNDGHGFAQCLRCGRPIVRTIVHGWRLPPRGYHIRWPQRARSTPPAPPQVKSRPKAPRTKSDADFMGDPLVGSVSSAFDFDDFGGKDHPPATERRRSTP